MRKRAFNILTSFYVLIKKRRLEFFLFLFIFLSFLIIPSAARAGWVDDLATWIATRPLLLVVTLIVKLAIFLASLAGELVNWVLSPDFISYSYTNPAGPNANPIIKMGLSVTQSFVNMLLVLVLVYIALSTILRLAGYETKKLLVLFIAIALLVNFAPVICGLVVDASNILMNFFVSDLRTDVFASNMEAKTDSIMKGFDWGKSFSEVGQAAIQLLVISAFLFILTFILLFFAAIFAIRYVIIWMLVILSPLAFVFYVLPVTRKYFESWWKQLFNWSFIGVTFGFFLYLGMQFVVLTQSGNAIGDASTTKGSGAFDAILPFFVCVGFLAMGIVFGISTAAMGSSTVLSLSKKVGRRARAGASRSAKALGRKTAKGAKARVLERRKLRGAARGITRKVQKVPILRWAMPEALRKAAETSPSLNKYQKEIDYMWSQNAAAAAMPGKGKLSSAAFPKEKATAAMLNIINKGDAADWMSVAKKKYGASPEELFDAKTKKGQKFHKDMGKLMKVAHDGGQLSKITRQDPRFAKIAASQGIGGYAGMTEKDAVRKAVGEARAQHISQWDPDALKDKDVIESAMGALDKDRWLQINRSVKGGQDAAHKGMRQAYDSFLEREGLEDNEESHEAYQKYIEDKNDGNSRYFRALRDKKRMGDTGWSNPWEIKKEKTKEEKEATPSPGEASGIKKQGRKSRSSSSGRKPEGGKSIKGRKASKNKPPKGRKR